MYNVHRVRTYLSPVGRGRAAGAGEGATPVLRCHDTPQPNPLPNGERERTSFAAMLNSNSRVAIIGAGPAGLMAAEVLARGGAYVTVYDAMPSVGRKFLMAARGGGHFSHHEAVPPLLPPLRAQEP